MCGKHLSVEKWVNLCFQNINPVSKKKKAKHLQVKEREVEGKQE